LPTSFVPDGAVSVTFVDAPVVLFVKKTVPVVEPAPWAEHRSMVTMSPGLNVKLVIAIS
jgi:hypothetical protein